MKIMKYVLKGNNLPLLQIKYRWLIHTLPTLLYVF